MKSLAATEITLPSALQNASSNVLNSSIKKKFPSTTLAILVIRSSSWSFPKPNECIEKLSKFLFCYENKLFYKYLCVYLLSWPSESKNTDET